MTIYEALPVVYMVYRHARSWPCQCCRKWRSNPQVFLLCLLSLRWNQWEVSKEEMVWWMEWRQALAVCGFSNPHDNSLIYHYRPHDTNLNYDYSTHNQRLNCTYGTSLWSENKFLPKSSWSKPNLKQQLHVQILSYNDRPLDLSLNDQTL